METKSLKILFVDSYNGSVTKGDAITLNDVIVLCSLARMCDDNDVDIDSIPGRLKPEELSSDVIYNMQKIVAQKILDGCVLDELTIDQITSVEALLSQIEFERLGLFVSETGLIRVIKAASMLQRFEPVFVAPLV